MFLPEYWESDTIFLFTTGPIGFGCKWISEEYFISNPDGEKIYRLYLNGVAIAYKSAKLRARLMPLFKILKQRIGYWK